MNLKALVQLMRILRKNPSSFSPGSFNPEAEKNLLRIATKATAKRRRRATRYTNMVDKSIFSREAKGQELLGPGADPGDFAAFDEENPILTLLKAIEWRKLQRSGSADEIRRLLKEGPGDIFPIDLIVGR